MNFSKSSLLLALTASFVLAACGERRSRSAEATFRVESISAVGTSLVSSEKSTKWGMAKTKIYNFKACLKDDVIRDPIIRTKFSISDGETQKTVATDLDGCLLWSENFDVNLTKPETLFEMTRSFTALETYSGTVSLTFAFNPWAEAEAAIDLRKETPPVKPQKVGEIRSGSAPTKLWKYPTTWSPYVSPSSIAFKYAGEARDKMKITDLLSLEVAHNYEVRFSPSLMTRNMIGQWNGHELTEGQVKLRILFIKESATTVRPEDVISSFEKVFTILEDKSAFDRVVLPINNVADAASRMKAIAEITPIDDDNSGMQTAYFEGLVDPLTSSSFSIEFNPNPRTDSRIQNMFSALDAAYAQPQASNLNGLAALEKFSGLKADALTDLKDSANDLILGQLSPGDAAYRKLVLGLCSKVYSSDVVSQMSARGSFCNDGMFSTPGKSLDIAVEDVVVQVTSPAKQVGSTREYSLSITNSFGYSSSFSTGVGGGYKASVGVGLPFADMLSKAVGKFLTLELGGEVYHSTSYSRTRTSERAGSTTLAENITAIGNTYEFDVNYKRCLIFKMNAENEKLLPKTGARPKVGSYYCSDKVSKKSARETFYFVNQTIGASAFTDPASADSTKWRMMVRGKREFELFKTVVENRELVLNFEKFSQKIEGGVLPKEFRMTQKYPGILSGE